MNNNVFL